MRKPAYCICENKDADQLHGNRTADQCLCFCYEDFYGCTAKFVSDLVRIPVDRFSHDMAHIIYYIVGW